MPNIEEGINSTVTITQDRRRGKATVIITLSLFAASTFWNVIRIVGDHGGISFAFSNAINVSTMIGAFAATFLLAFLASALVLIVQKFIFKKKATFWTTTLIAYVIITVITVALPKVQSKPAVLSGRLLTVLNRMKVNFDEIPVYSYDAQHQLTNYVYISSSLSETCSVNKITGAILEHTQQLTLLEKVLQGIEERITGNRIAKEILDIQNVISIRTIYSIKNGGTDVSMEVEVFMVDGWCVVLQMACPSGDYAQYKGFVENIEYEE
jgi:hypothetical protein